MLSVDEVRKYNAELKERKKQASDLNAQIGFYEKELEKKCSELSKELGIEVTKDNLEQVYAEYEQKLQSAMETGWAVLRKIAQDETIVNIDTSSIPGMQNGSMMAGLGQQVVSGATVGQPVANGVNIGAGVTNIGTTNMTAGMVGSVAPQVQTEQYKQNVQQTQTVQQASMPSFFGAAMGNQL